MAQMTPQPSPVAVASSAALRMVLAAAFSIVLMLSLTAARAGAQTATTYPPVTNPPTTIIIDPNANDDDIIEAGETVNFTVGGFKPGTEVCFYVEDQLVGCDIADENGFAEYDWTVPAGTATGDYDLQVEGVDPSGAPLTLEGTFYIEVNGAFVPGDGSGPLPYTGSDSVTLVRIAVVLLLAGGVSVVAMRRRGARTNA